MRPGSKTPALLRGALLAALALALAPHAARGQHVLSIATLAPAGSPPMRVLEAVNRDLRRRTQQRLSLRFYPGGVQGDEAEVVRKVRIGRLDGGALTATGLGQVHRPTLAFQLPAIFTSAAGFVRAYTALRPALEREFDRSGFVLLHLSPSDGARMFSTQAITAPEQLRAARPWQWPDDPILPALYAEVGARGVPLAIPEVLGALSTRRVDVVFAPPLGAIALQWSAQVRFMSEQPASGSLNGLVVSRRAWDALPADEQAALRAVIDQAVVVFGRAAARVESEALATLAARGVQTVALTEPQRARWLAVFAGVRRRLTGVIADAAWLERVRLAGAGPSP